MQNVVPDSADEDENEDPNHANARARAASPFLYSDAEEGSGSFGTYDECFADFKDKVAKVKDVWATLPAKAGDPVEISSCKKFADMHSTLQYSEYGKKDDRVVNKQFIGRFMKDGRLNGDRVFRAFGMYSDPRACPADEFNLWTPFAVESITAEGDSDQRIDDLAFLLRHLFILSGRSQLSTRTNPPCPIVCSVALLVSQVLYDHMLDWKAHFFQYPDVKSHMLCNIGGQGCGKSIIYGDTEDTLGLLANMMGKCKFFTTAEPEKYVWGMFNSIMASAYYVNLNEVGNFFTHIGNINKGVGQLKTLIKQKEMTINDKGVPHVKSQSLAKYAYTANPRDGANIPTEDAERRYVVIRCSDELCSGTFEGAPVKEYFIKLGGLVVKLALLRDFYDYLMARPVSKTFHKDDMPVSNLQMQLNAANRDSIDQWLSSLKWDEGQTTKKLTNNAVWASFKDFCESESIPLRLREQQFKNQLGTRPFVTAYHEHNGRGKLIDREGLERALPPAPEEQGSHDPEPDFKAIATDFFNQRLATEIAADPGAWKAARKAEARARKQERLAQERVRKLEREEAAYEAMAAADA